MDTEEEILPHTYHVPVQIVDKNDYFDVSGIEAFRISGERYDKCINAVISSAYVNTPEGKMPDDFYIQDWQPGTGGVRSGLAANDARMNGTLLDAALSDRLEFSKFAMAIGSTTSNKGSCELFMVELDELEEYVAEAWTEISSTTAGSPKGVTADIISKIWTISHEMAEKTIQIKSQLNREGENTSLERNLGTNDRMLRYRRIKSHFFTDTFFVIKKARSTRG